MLALLAGVLFRRTSRIFGARALPRTGTSSPEETARLEPGSARLHGSTDLTRLSAQPADGDPPRHWIMERATELSAPGRYVLEIANGTVVGNFGANITPGGVLDFATSPYFGVSDWREHPVFLSPRLPAPQHVRGTVAALTTRGGNANYYHFLLEVLPRLGTLESVLPGVTADAFYVPRGRGFQEQLLEMAGLDQRRLIASSAHTAIRADRLLVPSFTTRREIAAPWLVDWVRTTFPTSRVSNRPARLFITRNATRRRTRRLETESSVWPMLERRGFVRVDPGTLSVQEQIDTFAAAQVIVGVHGAALTNLVFTSPGVRVLEIFAPTYVQHCYWSLLTNIPDSRYRYVVGEGDTPVEGKTMQGIQNDIVIEAARVERSLDLLLEQ